MIVIMNKVDHSGKINMFLEDGESYMPLKATMWSSIPRRCNMLEHRPLSVKSIVTKEV